MSIALNLFIVAASVQCIYYIVVFARLNFIKNSVGVSDFLPPVSIVICAKNEEQNLAQNLKVILIQQYSQYEVIVVNDQSTDASIEVLVDYYNRNKNFKIVTITKDEKKPFEGKKYALLKGIEAATFDTIVVTDADCRPATTHWLANIVSCYLDNTKIVLAHSPFEKRAGFLNKLIRYENFITALQYFGFAKLGLPYMGVGRNLSYKKELFKSFKGFEKNSTLLSGDDDLFINAVANSKNTEICLAKDSFTYTKPQTNFKDWINQKRRHLQTGFKYKWYHIIVLFLFALSSFMFYSLFFLLLGKLWMLKIVLSVFIGTVLIKLAITYRIFKKLGVNDLRFLSLPLDFFYILYLFLLFFLLLLKPKKSWK